MSKIIDKIELLAPAGRPLALYAAVQNGADAVYLGEKNFSARKSAMNFTTEELREAVRYCHIRGVKVHLALNTLIDTTELKEFEKTVVRAVNSGIDAVIVQDLGAARIIKEVCPTLPMHASTQMTACCSSDVEALEKMGFSRVVLARELSHREIEEIHRNSDCELEAFVHGALCISFSGKCLMSSFIGGRSGNRGMCAQPCRQYYSAENKKGYFLSPRDLCLACEIEKMRSAGISSLKIEGRMKSAEYVATVTSVYRKCIDERRAATAEEIQRLEKIFVRGDGFTKGYFENINTPQIMNYSQNNDNITYRADEEVLKEARYSFREGAENKKIPVEATLTIVQNKESKFTLSDNEGNSVSVEGDVPQEAVNVPITIQSAKERMAKMGQTPFELSDIKVSVGENLSLPVSELNRLRREAAEKLENERAKILKRETFEIDYPTPIERKREKMYIAVQVMTKEQYYKTEDADIVLLPPSLWNEVDIDARCALVLPDVTLDEKATAKLLSEIEAPKGVYVSSLGGALLAKKYGHKVVANSAFNIYNTLSLQEAFETVDGATLSPELNLSAIKKITDIAQKKCEAIAYGNQTVMTSRACLIRGIRGKCDCKDAVKIKDKTGAEFTVFGDRSTHLNTVINSRPTFMADKLKDLAKSGLDGIRLVFTTESGEETEKIIKMYKGKIQAEKPRIYTRGYFMK